MESLETRLAALRADTPGVQHVIHLNNAGCALPPAPVLEAQLCYLREEAHRGGYRVACELDLDDVYEQGARLLGVAPEDMAYFESATLAWNAAFWAIPWRAGDRVVMGRASYVSNALAILRCCERFQIEVDLVDDDEQGQIDIEGLRSAMGPKTRIICLTQVPTSSGLVNPAAEVGKVAAEAGVLYLLDACQSAGQMPLRVSEIGCHMLSFTGRKYLRGPRGSGMLYVSPNAIEKLEAPLVCDSGGAVWTGSHSYRLRPGARRFETFEHSMASKAGLAVAIRYALEVGIDEIEERTARLAAHLRDLLTRLDGIEVLDRGAKLCGIVTFRHAHLASSAVAEALRVENINVSVTRNTSSQLSLGHRGVESAVRASVHYYNTEEELEQLVRHLNKLTRR